MVKHKKNSILTIFFHRPTSFVTCLIMTTPTHFNHRNAIMVLCFSCLSQHQCIKYSFVVFSNESISFVVARFVELDHV
jgi:hypothetical protein